MALMGYKYRIFLLLSLILLSCNKNGNQLKSQSETSDSLEYFLERANNDSVDASIRKNFNERALTIVSKQPNDSLNRESYFRVAGRYYNLNLLDQYRDITRLIIKNSKSVNDSASIAKAYSYMSDYFVKLNQPDSVYDYNYKAEKLYLRLNDEVNLVQTLLNKAVLQHNYGDFLGCEKTAFEMLRILKKYDNVEMEYEANNLLGIVYAELQEFDLSKKYYDRAVELGSSKSIPKALHYETVTKNNIGIMFSTQKKYSIAKDVFLEGLKEKNLFTDRPVLFAVMKDNLAYAKFKIGDFTGLPEMFYEALKIRDSLDITTGIIVNKIHLSEYYAYKKDSIQAIKFAKEAYSLAIEKNQKRESVTGLRQLMDVNPKSAGVYIKEYNDTRDSLDIAERTTKNKFARIEFETDELAQDNVQLVEQRKTLIYIALGIILIGVFIFVIRVQAAKNRELRLVQEQQKANEEIYSLMISQQDKVEETRQAEKKRIAQELHDGVLGKLFGTRMNLGVLNSRKDDDSIGQRVGYIDELKTLEQEIREISHDLNSEKTAVFNNFVLMVTNFIETQRTVCQSDITIQMDPAIEWNAVENTAKINLYRILQEAFQNINKHAKSKNVHVTFKQKDSLIQLKVNDDGVGFVYSKKRNGIGLQNMLSRITTSGGAMDIITKPGDGTTLQFELPLT
jgi:signal transduction histidine kinase